MSAPRLWGTTGLPTERVREVGGVAETGAGCNLRDGKRSALEHRLGEIHALAYDLGADGSPQLLFEEPA